MSGNNPDHDMDAGSTDRRIKDLSMEELSKAIQQYKKARQSRRDVLGGISMFQGFSDCLSHIHIFYSFKAYRNRLEERLHELQDQHIHGEWLLQITTSHRIPAYPLTDSITQSLRWLS
jgi:hypothetical protein